MKTIAPFDSELNISCSQRLFKPFVKNNAPFLIRTKPFLLVLIIYCEVFHHDLESGVANPHQRSDEYSISQKQYEFSNDLDALK